MNVRTLKIQVRLGPNIYIAKWLSLAALLDWFVCLRSTKRHSLQKLPKHHIAPLNLAI